MLKAWILAGLFCLSAGALAATDLPAPARQDAFPIPSAESVLLGRDLFFDPILSGNRNISCGTCHHPALAGGDEMSLSIGEGGIGLGKERVPDPANLPRARVPRNAPALFNLGAAEFTTLFHDGRVQLDPNAPFGIRMPPDFPLERAAAGPLAAQAALPVTSHDEMAGQPGENEIADAVITGHVHGPDGAWAMLAARIAAIPEYRQRFAWLKGNDDPLHITDIGQVIGDFIAFEFRSVDSPFDAFLRGDDSALSNDQRRGMSLFYGKARCATCHSGLYQTDHGFHALGLPPIGPGKGHGPDGYADHGRAGVTGDRHDLYSFRTPSLRNVTITAPYGHNGAYAELEDIIRHHLDPLTWLAQYKVDKALLPKVETDIPDTAALDDFDEMLRIAMSVRLDPLALRNDEIQAIIAFLAALEDPQAGRGRLGAPYNVPSGLPVDTGPMDHGTGTASSSY